MRSIRLCVLSIATFFMLSFVSQLFGTSLDMPAARDMILVEQGTFMMGDTWGDGWLDERPVHIVTLTYDFWIGKYPVTFDEYDAFCEGTERRKPRDAGWGEFSAGRGTRPVTDVTWWDAVAYCNWLSEKEGLPIAYDDSGNFLDAKGTMTVDPSKVVGYRLPTEAEWEYAARGGLHQSQNKYAGSDNVDEVSWYWNNSYFTELGIRITWPVGLRLPNSLGLYDMSGNVWEWCSDRYAEYSAGSQTNPYVSIGSNRIVRGGGWDANSSDVRVANRNKSEPSSAYSTHGFRVTRTAK